jgi:hypothetical protein
MTAQNPASPDGEWVMVPKRALDWLLGEGPDEQGHWFGDGDDPAGRRGRYWWRTQFCNMLASAPRPDVGKGQWFALPYILKQGPCATENCLGEPVWRFEGGGVGSDYCLNCHAKLTSAPPRPDADAKLADDLARRFLEAAGWCEGTQLEKPYSDADYIALFREAASLTERAVSLEKTASEALWTFCYDVATAFQHDNSHAGIEFFKRAKRLGVLLESEAGDSVREGLQSASVWRPHTPEECEQFCQASTASEALQECERLRAALKSADEVLALYLFPPGSPIRMQISRALGAAK